MFYFHAFLLALVALLASGGASAQHVTGAPFVPLPLDYFETAGRIRVTQPIDHLTLPGGRRLFDTADLDTDGGSGVRAKGGGNIRNPSGNDLGVQTTSRIPNGTAGGAIGRATGKIVKGFLGPTLGTGLAVWELYKELGFDLTKDAAGEPVVRKLDSSLCTVAPCYKYQILDYNGSYAAYQTTPSKSCEAALPSFPTSLGAQYVLLGTTNPTYQCKFTAWDGSNLFTRQVEYESTPAVAQQYFPSSQQEFIDAVAAKSGWPSTSALSRALADAVAATGEKIATGTPTVTGPATSLGTTTTTTNPVNNTTTTNTVTHQHTYAGDTITNTTINNTTTTNNTTGDTITNTTTTGASTPAPAPVDTCGMPGKPACKIDETGTATYDADKLKLDKTKLDTDSEVQRTTIKGTADKGMFASWSTFFSLPSLRACEPVEMPAYMGQQIGSMNVCPGAEWLRGLMGFIWATAGFLFCFRTVSEVI